MFATTSVEAEPSFVMSVILSASHDGFPSTIQFN